MSSDHVTIVEVGPRDGLQNEAAMLSPQTRIAFVEKLLDAGLETIEVGSFVSPKWVPQMSNTEEVLRAVEGRKGNFSVLVPNEKGLDGAIAAGAKDIAIFAAATETFSAKNINCSIDQSLERFRPVVERALAHGMRVRGYVSCVLGCPYEGEVDVRQVVRVADALTRFGCYEISLGDTIGVGSPGKARTLVRAVAAEVPVAQLAAHFHDTYGQALANIYVALEEGVRVVDSAAGGLGGCPYAPGASGNVATETLLYMLDGMSIETGVDMPRVLDAVRFISEALGRPPRSNVFSAMQN